MGLAVLGRPSLLVPNFVTRPQIKNIQPPIGMFHIRAAECIGKEKLAPSILILKLIGGKIAVVIDKNLIQYLALIDNG